MGGIQRFPAMASRLQGAETVLTGLLDRSALYGVLAEVGGLLKAGRIKREEQGIEEFIKRPSGIEDSVFQIPAYVPADLKAVLATADRG